MTSSLSSRHPSCREQWKQVDGRLAAAAGSPHWKRERESCDQMEGMRVSRQQQEQQHRLPSAAAWIWCATLTMTLSHAQPLLPVALAVAGDFHVHLLS